MSARRAPFKVAIAGCHRMLTRTPQSHNWAAAFAAVPETRIAGVFDKGADTRAAFVACWDDVAAYDDYDRMLREVQPDIVCIATRQTMHADMAEKAAAAGVRGIHFEKPLATSMAEVDRIEAACRTHGVAVVFGVDRRWWAAAVELRKRLLDGLVGEVQSIIGYGLPQLINHGSHWYDVMLGLAGDPAPTWASGHVEDVSHDPPDSRRRLDPPGRGWFGFGDHGLGFVTYDGGPAHAYEVIGDRGRLLILNDFEDALLIEPAEGAAPGDRPGLKARPLEFLRNPPGWPAGPAMMRELVHAIETGEPTACDMARACIITELGFAFHASHARGGARVTFPIQNRTLRVISYPWGNE